ncbi:hypothetical protein KQH82_02525 [bacterium]|nr:hypothetical protein [bacterium]
MKRLIICTIAGLLLMAACDRYYRYRAVTAGLEEANSPSKGSYWYEKEVGGLSVGFRTWRIHADPGLELTLVSARQDTLLYLLSAIQMSKENAPYTWLVTRVNNKNRVSSYTCTVVPGDTVEIDYRPTHSERARAGDTISVDLGYAYTMDRKDSLYLGSAKFLQVEE